MKRKVKILIDKLYSEKGEAELCEKLAVSKETLSKWIYGISVPSANYLFKLAELAGMPAQELIDKYDFSEDIMKQKVKRLLVKLYSEKGEAKLCEKLGVSKGMLTEWLYGGSVPSANYLFKLAELAGMQAKDLIEKYDFNEDIITRLNKYLEVKNDEGNLILDYLKSLITLDDLDENPQNLAWVDGAFTIVAYSIKWLCKQTSGFTTQYLKDSLGYKVTEGRNEIINSALKDYEDSVLDIYLKGKSVTTFNGYMEVVDKILDAMENLSF